MKTSDFSFDYPDHLIATSRAPVSRVLMGGIEPTETTISHLISRFKPEDVLVINTTKVIKARVTLQSGLEVLFLQKCQPPSHESEEWEVLAPTRKWQKTGEFLPTGERLELLQSGMPQRVRVPRTLTPGYFLEHGDLPLPPYIQQKRQERQSRKLDEQQYQTAWAQHEGSLAAPTASLHFSQQDLMRLRERGTEVVSLCLHVGLGTFLPIHSDSLEEHRMHSETVSIPAATLEAIERAKASGGRVWALGTTVMRALESWPLKYFNADSNGGLFGSTDLFIRPGFEFKIVDNLLTNFHQPESTLLVLVSAFAGRDTVLQNYQWAMDRGFRLFSYGDLTVWQR